MNPRFLWADRSVAASMCRVALLPASAAYRTASGARALAYRHHLLKTHRLPAPSVAVGNLSVGGTGKTPVTAWIAAYYGSRGFRPGVLLRGYGGDEGGVLRRLVPDAIVVESPDRLSAAERAVKAGAQVLVLDDAFQRLDVARDVNLVLISAESISSAAWTLPAGPWREGWKALTRADLIVVTRKAAELGASVQLAQRVSSVAPRTPLAYANLAIRSLRSLKHTRQLDPTALAGARVLAAAGIADPESFEAQLQGLGAATQLMALGDHHRFTRRDVNILVQESSRFDYVVITEKDAVKLEVIWPDEAPEPLVANLQVVWERGEKLIRSALDNLVYGLSGK